MKGNETMVQSGEQPATPRPGRLRFQLSHGFYVMAVLAASLAVFGASGVVPTIIITMNWWLIITSRSRRIAFRKAILITLVGVILLSVAMWVMISTHQARSAVQNGRNVSVT